jgi:hypothetical protein
MRIWLSRGNFRQPNFARRLARAECHGKREQTHDTGNGSRRRIVSFAGHFRLRDRRGKAGRVGAAGSQIELATDAGQPNPGGRHIACQRIDQHSSTGDTARHGPGQANACQRNKRDSHRNTSTRTLHHNRHKLVNVS